MPAPQKLSTPPPRDLSDEEFAQLDELLLATPEPLEPVDVVMLDGYLCGVLVQPVLLTSEEWLPHVFDFDGRPLPEGTDAAWLEATTTLVMRRYTALNRALVEDGWFDPLVLEPDDEADASAAADNTDGAEAPATDTADTANTGTSHTEGTDAEAAPENDAYAAAAAGLPPISQALMPWVAGFQHASLCFPELAEMPEDAVASAMARLFRHLPAETDDEKEVVAVLDREFPLAKLDDAIEELVVTIADLADLTREARYHVDTIKRDTPKLGRNDPCHCGSGKKFKACHGK